MVLILYTMLYLHLSWYVPYFKVSRQWYHQEISLDVLDPVMIKQCFTDSVPICSALRNEGEQERRIAYSIGAIYFLLRVIHGFFFECYVNIIFCCWLSMFCPGFNSTTNYNVEVNSCCICIPCRSFIWGHGLPPSSKRNTGYCRRTTTSCLVILSKQRQNSVPKASSTATTIRPCKA